MYMEEKIDNLISKQEQLIEMVQLFLPNIESEKGVIHFLEITKNTFNNYINNGVFVEGIHYIKKNNKRVFIPTEVINSTFAHKT